MFNFHAFEVESIESVLGDTVLDIKVLPNRSHDCLSHIGIARELSVISGRKLIPLKTASVDFSVLKSTDHIGLVVEDSKIVPRALKRLVTDVVVGPSPAWMRRRLEVLGQRSINNIVDITNYVTLELGQPVHAFDFDKLAGTDASPKQITIRRAHDGEKLTTLDGREHTLDSSIWVIADRERALDVAGIKGGSNSQIDENTKRIMLSACTFDPVMIRRASQKLALRTDASVRFENGISPELAYRAMGLLSDLLHNLRAGKVAVDLVESYPRPQNPYKVGFIRERSERLLGMPISDAQIEDIFSRLGIRIEKIRPLDQISAQAKLLVGVPYLWAASVSADAPHAFDCSSFTSYLFSQAGISLPRVTIDQYFYGTEIAEAELAPGDLIFSLNGEDNVRTESRDFLPGKKTTKGVNHVGLYIGKGEVIHSSGMWHKGTVVVEKYLESPAFKKIVAFVRIPGIASERYVATIPSERLDLRQEADLIEELGRLIGYDHLPTVPFPLSKTKPEILSTLAATQTLRGHLAKAGFSEVITYSLVAKGDRALENPLTSDRPFMRTNLLDGMRVSLEENKRHQELLGGMPLRLFEIGAVFPQSGEEVRAALLVEKGEKVADFLPASVPFVSESPEAIEFRLSDLVGALGSIETYPKLDFAEGVEFNPISAYPEAVRDIAVFVPEGVSSETVWDLIAKKTGQYFVHGRLFDTFIKKDPTGNRVSYAFRLVFQSHDHTLSGEDISRAMDAVTKALSAQEGWKVR